MVLAMYEITKCPEESETGGVSHRDGIAKLIKHRGIEAHTSLLGY
jgi:hypothetical protein